MGENPFHGNQVSLHMGTPSSQISVVVLYSTYSKYFLVPSSFFWTKREKENLFNLFILSINVEKLFGMPWSSVGLECVQNTKSLYNVPLIIYEPEQQKVLTLFSVGCKSGSWTLHLRTLHLRMLSLRHFIFGQLNLRLVTPSEISPSECYTFGMFHLWDVSPSGCFTFGQLHLRRFHLWEVTHLNFSPLDVFRNCRRCNFVKL